MTVRYSLSPHLGISLIFCEGTFTDIEYFKTVIAIHADPAFRPGMRQIVDLRSAVEDITLDGLRSVIKYREEMAKFGIGYEPVILLTYSRSIFLLVDSIKLLISKPQVLFEAVTTLDEAISLFGLQDKKQAIFDFYNSSKTQTRSAPIK